MNAGIMFVEQATGRTNLDITVSSALIFLKQLKEFKVI